MANSSSVVITKVSGVLFVAVDSLPAKAFFGATGNYQFSTDTTTVVITVGNYQSTTPVLNVQVPWTGLRVGTSTPTTYSQATTLLNAIFGS